MQVVLVSSVLAQGVIGVECIGAGRIDARDIINTNMCVYIHIYIYIYSVMCNTLYLYKKPSLPPYNTYLSPLLSPPVERRSCTFGAPNVPYVRAD